ncbi:hypothetical protein GCK32_016159 [Trichostrongylus colubriformis]|uniref:Serpentine receptor class gamma n=1 Tax=Trichostrongylus colubriformis TaxID=6319 RepID=A0AAN8FS40_TRICO
MTTLPVGPYITILYVLSYYSVYMTFYSAAILSLARSIIICSPMQGNEIVRKLLPLCFLVIYLLPVLTTWFLFPVISYMRIGTLPGYGVAIDYKKIFPQPR